MNKKMTRLTQGMPKKTPKHKFILQFVRLLELMQSQKQPTK
jgi:hypothetical protein